MRLMRPLGGKEIDFDTSLFRAAIDKSGMPLWYTPLRTSHKDTNYKKSLKEGGRLIEL